MIIFPTHQRQERSDIGYRSSRTDPRRRRSVKNHVFDCLILVMLSMNPISTHFHAFDAGMDAVRVYHTAPQGKESACWSATWWVRDRLTGCFCCSWWPLRGFSPLFSRWTLNVPAGALRMTLWIHALSERFMDCVPMTPVVTPTWIFTWTQSSMIPMVSSLSNVRILEKASAALTASQMVVSKNCRLYFSVRIPTVVSAQGRGLYVLSGRFERYEKSETCPFTLVRSKTKTKKTFVLFHNFVWSEKISEGSCAFWSKKVSLVLGWDRHLCPALFYLFMVETLAQIIIIYYHFVYYYYLFTGGCRDKSKKKNIFFFAVLKWIFY